MALTPGSHHSPGLAPHSPFSPFGGGGGSPRVRLCIAPELAIDASADRRRMFLVPSRLATDADATVRALADEISALCGGARVRLRVGGYALDPDTSIAVVRDGDEIHVARAGGDGGGGDARDRDDLATTTTTTTR